MESIIHLDLSSLRKRRNMKFIVSFDIWAMGNTTNTSFTGRVIMLARIVGLRKMNCKMHPLSCNNIAPNMV